MPAVGKHYLCAELEMLLAGVAALCRRINACSSLNKGIYTISSWDQHKGWETNVDPPVITQSRRLPLGATLFTLQQSTWCWPGQINQQWLGGLQPVSVVIHA